MGRIVLSPEMLYWLPKLMYFVLFAGFGAIASFLPVFYFDEKKLTLTQVGAIGLTIPLCKFLASPLLSSIADKSGRHRLVLIAAAAVTVTLRFMLLEASSFPAILLIAVSGESIGSVIAPIFENGVLHILPDRNQYGRQRLFGAAGYGTAVLMSGLSIEAAHAFWPMFVLSACLYFIMTMLSFRLELTFQTEDDSKHQKYEISLDSSTESSEDEYEVKSSSAAVGDKTDTETEKGKGQGKQGQLRDILTVMTSDVFTITFFVTIVLSGIGFGFIENYLFIYIEELGGDKTVQGVARFVMCAAEIPMFFYADALFQRVGTAGCLMITFIGFIARFVFYAFVTKPWLVIIAEPLHGMTFAAMWTAATRKAFEIAPVGLGATMQGVVGGLHFGLGQGLGALCGGVLYETYGARPAFLSAACLTAFAFVLILAAELHRRRGGRISLPIVKYERLEQEDTDILDATDNDIFSIGSDDSLE